MATNKVVINGETKIDLTADTVTAADVAQGKTFHDASGAIVIGTAAGGSGGALSILVTAPTGSTVTAEKDGSTYTGVEDAENPGEYTVSVPEYGTYTVTSEKDGRTASGDVTLLEEEIELSYFSATINITAPSGSTVAVEKGGETVNTHVSTGGAVAVTVIEAGTYAISCTDGTNTASATAVIASSGDSVNVTLAYTSVWGVMWDYSNSSTALTRLTPATDPNGYVTMAVSREPVSAVGTGSGSSPFDDYLPWSGMEEYNIINNAVSYKKGESGFSRTANDTVVKIPEFYYAVVDNASGKKRYWYISNAQIDGFEKHPGSGRYVGKYNTGANYVSKSGIAPVVNITRAAARTGSHNRGSKWWQYDYATYCAIELLYLIEHADWNSQSKVGRGYVDGNSEAINTGGTDSMTYHTGRAAGEDGKTPVQYRGIENPWGNVFEWADGINFTGRATWVSTNNASFADDTSSGYTNSGVTIPSTNQYITGIGYSAAVKWSMIPNAASGGSETTYVPDYVYSDTGWRVLNVGGAWGSGSAAGLFYFRGDGTASHVSASLGSRLLYIP